MEKQRILLIDMDIIAYRAAAVSETRTIEVLHKASGKSKSFKTRTEFKKYLKDNNIEYSSEFYEIQDVQQPKPVAHALQIVKAQVNKLKTELEASDVYGFIGKGDTNFRLNLDLPKLYKGQRVESIRPVHLDAAKKYATENYYGGYIDGIEVDDEVVIKYHELFAKGYDPVILTIDKDNKGCVGTKFYDWTQEKPKIVEVPAFGFLEYIKGEKSSKVDGLGYNFLMYQLLFGDAADNYHIGDLAKARFGDISVVNYLNQAKDVNDLFELTEAKYKEWFGDSFTYTCHDGRVLTKNYKEILEMYFQVAYMKRMRNDKTTFYSLWEESCRNYD